MICSRSTLSVRSVSYHVKCLLPFPRQFSSFAGFHMAIITHEALYTRQAYTSAKHDPALIAPSGAADAVWNSCQFPQHELDARSSGIVSGLRYLQLHHLPPPWHRADYSSRRARARWKLWQPSRHSFHPHDSHGDVSPNPHSQFMQIAR